MIEPEQCIICLEPLPQASASGATLPPALAPQQTTATAIASPSPAPGSNNLDFLASLDGCEHIIHDACIRSWAQKTNTCPICRIPFHSVRVYGVHGTAVSSYDVQDKKQVVDFDAEQWQAQNPDLDDGISNPCPICNSAEREDILLLCDSCDAAYHTHCIGLYHVPDGDWYCMECAHLFELTDGPEASDTKPPISRPSNIHRPQPRQSRGYHVRTRARLRRARRQARTAEWQGAWGQFSGRFFEMSDLDLDNHHEDEELEQFRRFQQNDLRELQRWQQRVDIAGRLGARNDFASHIPPQISERLRPASPPPEESRDERRAWGAFNRAREADSPHHQGLRKRKPRSITASPSEPLPEPERKLKRPRTRRLPTTQGEPSTLATAATTAATVHSPGSATSPPARLTNGTSATAAAAAARHASLQPDVETEMPLVSSLLKELEPHAATLDEDAAATTSTLTWRLPPEASSPTLPPSPSNHSSPHALSLTPPPYRAPTAEPHPPPCRSAPTSNRITLRPTTPPPLARASTTPTPSTCDPPAPKIALSSCASHARAARIRATRGSMTTPTRLRRGWP